MKNSEYKSAFKETYFIVLGDPWSAGDICISVGKIPYPLFKTIPNIHTWAFITAWNPLPVVLSQKENDLRNAQFHKLMTQEGYQLYKGVGKAPDNSWHEDSFLVLNIKNEVAMHWAKRFGQMAFVFGEKDKKAELIFCE